MIAMPQVVVIWNIPGNILELCIDANVHEFFDSWNF